MAKRSRKNIDRVIAIVASLVLAFGLVPVTASAAGEGPDGPGGQAPNISKTVAAAGPEAPPAPTETGDDAAGGGKAGEGGAQDGAGASGEDPGETGDAKADTPADGDGENAPGAAPTDDGAAGGGKADAPAEGAAEGAPGAAPADAGGDEGKGGPVGQADKPGDPGQAGQVDNPGEAGGPEPTAPAAGDGEAAANAQAAQPTAQAGGVAAGAKAQFPAFRQSRTVGDVTVAVEAEAGAFPKDAKLSVAGAPASATEAAVAPERGAGENVAASYTFDVKVLGKDDKELQPKGGKAVRVSFAAAEVADPNLDVSVYHVSGGAAEELPVSESGSTATAQSTGFSYYTVEFTYGDLQYVLQGGEEVTLSEVLAVVGLVGEPTDVQVSDSELFSASRESGEWVVTSHQAFSSTEWMRVTIAGKPYKIAVTDSTVVGSGNCGINGDNLKWTLDNEGNLTISGTGAMCNYTACGPWGHSIKHVVIGDGVTSIGDHAFQKSALKSVAIGKDVERIGDYAFEYCMHLKSIEIPASVRDIGEKAFEYCEGLESLTFAENSQLKTIGVSAFKNASKLTSVTIPDSVTGIGEEAFSYCILSSVTIGKNVTSIGNGAFNVENNVYFNGTKTEWESSVWKEEDWGGFNPTVTFLWCQVAVTANFAEGGTVSGGGTYQRNQTVTATATPKDGYAFDQWTEDGETVKDEEGRKVGAEYTFPVTADRTLVANFRQVSIGDIADQAYTGSAIEPKDLHVELIGVDGASLNEALIEGEDYTLSYENNVNAGEAAVIVTLDNRFSGKAKKVFNILPADISTATVEAADQVYDGTALEPVPAVTWDGKQVAKEDYTATYLGNVRAGEATVTVTGKRNFKDTTSTSGTFEIKKRPITITADSAEKAYDGTALTADGFTSEGLAEGDRVASAKVEGSQTGVGSSPNEVSDAKVVNAKGEDVTACYEIAYVPGTLTVDPAEATITVANASKAQGEPDPAFSGTVEGLVKDGDLGAISYKRTNSDEAPGTYKGVLTATYTDNPNYDVTVVSGDFTIEPAKPEYRVVSGAGGAWTEGSGASMVFKIERTVDPGTAFSHFVGIEVDGKAVPEKDASGKANWTARSGSVIVELQPAYLATLPAGKHTLTALFDDGDLASAEFEVSAAPVPATHTVTFDANGHGKAPAAQEVEDGGKAKKPANPTADGYTFGGWYTDKACKEAYDFSAPVTEDVTLYAKWTKKSSSRTTSKSPKTGDPLAGAFAVALALAAASALALAASRRRSRG